MTDIWRSFIAQRCLWEIGAGVAFHAPEVIQDRNEHNLLRDFQDEVPGYLSNGRIRELLDGLKLQPGESLVRENLLNCYEHLVAHGIFPADELPLVEAWLSDLAKVTKT
jgi:STELLO glycosyltransferases